MSNQIQLSGIFSEGYGFVPKKLMKTKELKSTSKLLLCYLLSYTGAGTECFPSIELITNDLGISKRTIISCIKESIEKGFISKKQIQRGRGIGKQNIYNLIFMNGLPSVNNTSANNARANKSNASAKNDTLQVQNSTSKSNSKSNNKSNNNFDYIIPQKLLDIKGFEETWNDWLQHKKEIKNKVTPVSSKRQFTLLLKQPNPIAVINKSIENGWKGLFEIKNYNSNNKLNNATSLETFFKRHNITDIDKANEIIQSHFSDYTIPEIEGKIGQFKYLISGGTL